MTSADFVAAQQRILERRQLRAQEQKTQRDLDRSQRVSHGLSRLPFPFTGLGRSTLDAWDTIKGREGTRPAFRVGQVDAELLDEELLELLRGQVGEALKYFGVSPNLHLTKNIANWSIGTSTRRLGIRDPSWSARRALQTFNMGPQCLVRSSTSKPSLYRCPTWWPGSSGAIPLAESCVRLLHCWWSVRLDEMGKLDSGAGRRLR